MAIKDGLHFGTQVVFTYGPLGFLDGPFIWYGDLAVLAFLYSAALYVGFCVALVWALRRSLPIVPSVLIAFLIVAVLPLLEQSILVAVLVCLGVLERERSQRTINLFVVGGASFAAVEALVKLSSGPIVALVFLVAVIGVGARWWQVLGFLGLMGAEILLLWLLAGQSLSTIPDFLENTWQVISGYSAAMLRQREVAAWKVILATLAAAIVTVGLVAASARARYRGPPSTLGGHRADGNSCVRGLQGGRRQDRRGASQPLLLDRLRPLDRHSLGQGPLALAVGRVGGDRRHGSTGSATRPADESQCDREREVRDGPISHPGQWIPAREADQRWALRDGNRVRPRSSDARRLCAATRWPSNRGRSESSGRISSIGIRCRSFRTTRPTRRDSTRPMPPRSKVPPDRTGSCVRTSWWSRHGPPAISTTDIRAGTRRRRLGRSSATSCRCTRHSVAGPWADAEPVQPTAAHPYGRCRAPAPLFACLSPVETRSSSCESTEPG